MNSYVIKSHKSNYPNPIEFNSNDIFEVGVKGKEYPGWIWVITSDSNEGWAPVKYVSFIEGTNKGIAKINYCAKELNVKLGEKLEINSTFCGWHHATNSRGEIGWVPCECVQFTVCKC